MVIDKADVLNRYRFFPRLFALMFMYLQVEVAFWFMTLVDPSTAQSNFAMATGAASAAYFHFYVNSGPIFGKHPERRD